MGGTASSAANDVSNAFNYKSLNTKAAARHLAKTRATMAREEARNAASGESASPAQPAPARAAPAPNYSAAPVASVAPVAPTVPDPDEIGETEQALLDQQKKGRSSTIATSAKGLLSGADATRKKRSLMGGLIS